ncbi:MAG: hypothetical protein ABIQ06_10295 [Caldimonas sp.]
MRAPYSATTATKEATSTPESIMSDNILTAVLTFSLLAGGTAAIGSEMFGSRKPAKAAAPVVVMPQVAVTASRAVPGDIVTMPAVVVTGRREAVTVAVETRASETARIE